MNMKTNLKTLILSLTLIVHSNHALAKTPYRTKPTIYKPSVAENGSYKGEYSKKTYRPKNEYVRPYKHKDGSRVRSHYKSKKSK